MRVAYDFHIHTALSPCGDSDMTPNNIINMACLKSLDVIAITDHNTCQNAAACMECGRAEGLLVLPGMEVETAEEVHVVCLFAELENALQMEEIVQAHLPRIQNRPDIFGEQRILNAQDEQTGLFEYLLSTATTLSVEDVVSHAKRCGGVAIPAHIDKDAYSIVSNLGFIPPDLPVRTVEIKNPERIERVGKVQPLESFGIVHNSDAHYLWDISERLHFLEVTALSAHAIIDIL
ncbi:MAG: PHP domain-containing protein [Ruminococcaceae bacterium]|nr:PHP domain-containing protein [Oscillospiraceae bacterium]